MTKPNPGVAWRRIAALTILLCFTFVVALSADGSVTQVRFFNDKTKTRVIFESNETLVYSAYQVPDKPTVLNIDFPDTELTIDDRLIKIGTDELSFVKFAILPLEGEAHILRAQFEMTSKLEHHISQFNNFMYIDFEKRQAVTNMNEEIPLADLSKPEKKIAEAIQTTSAKTESEPVSLKKDIETKPVAKSRKPESETSFPEIELPFEVREVTYDMQGDNLTINLLYTGKPEYSTFQLESPPRVIIDFHRAINRIQPRQISLNGVMVQKIRSAQFQSDPVHIARVVFDVNRPINYRILEASDHLKIVFGDDNYIAQLENSLKPSALPMEMAVVQTKEDARTDQVPPMEKPLRDAPDTSINSGTEITKTIDLSSEEKGEPVPIDIEKESKPKSEKTEIANEPSGQVQEKLFETANPAATPAALLGQQQQPPATKRMIKSLSADQDFTEKQVASTKMYTGTPININFKDADVRDILLIFGDITGKNFIVDPAVQGKVTINFKDVPWDQALDVILAINNLGKLDEDNIYIIASMQKLEDKAKRERRLQEEKELSGPTAVITRRISYAKAEEVAEIVKAYLSKRGQVLIDKRTNLLIIEELQDKTDGLMALIDELDIATRQVNIEARIVETNRNYTKDLGIQWGWKAIADEAHGNATRYIFPHDVSVFGAAGGASQNLVPYAVNLPLNSPTSGIGLSLGNVLDSVRIDLALTAMEESGQGRILSKPSVATQNNIEATILSGAKIPYTSIVDNTASVTFIQAKLELKVTPQITSDNTIIMDIKVEKTEPDYSRLITNVQGALPTILEKKADSTMLVKDGGTAVIGGILQINESEAQRVTPFFHKIPLIGWLFKAENSTRTDKELLIFVTPKILGYQ